MKKSRTVHYRTSQQITTVRAVLKQVSQFVRQHAAATHTSRKACLIFFYKRRQSFVSSLSGLAMHLAGYSTNPDNCEISRDTRTNCPPDCDTRILRKCERLFGYNRSNQMSINGALPHQIAYVPTIPEKYCFSSTSKPKGRYDRRRWAVLDELWKR